MLRGCADAWASANAARIRPLTAAVVRIGPLPSSNAKHTAPATPTTAATSTAPGPSVNLNREMTRRQPHAAPARSAAYNLLIWPSTQADAEEPHALNRQGYQLLHWLSGGMTYWAVSDLNAAELRTFADLVIRRLAQ